MTFLDRRHGLALSDPVGGKFRILATADGGRTWAVQPTAGMPAALPGEFAFAASGTCLVSATGGADAWFATGGGERARVFTTGDRGRTWPVTDSPLPSGPSAGIFSLAFRDPRHGIAVGGDYLDARPRPRTAPATTRDGGRTWTASAGRCRASTAPGATWVASAPVALAVGPTGSDSSVDGGRTWTRVRHRQLRRGALRPDLSCWASGENGRIAKLRF